MLRTKIEIEDEIKDIKASIIHFAGAYAQREISKEIFVGITADLQATIKTLKWVLGEER